MNAELWILLAKTGSTIGVILAAVAWLFRRGGRISLQLAVDFGGQAKSNRDNGAAEEDQA